MLNNRHIKFALLINILLFLSVDMLHAGPIPVTIYPQPPNIYYLIVGIDDYVEFSFRTRFSVSDAQSVYKALTDPEKALSSVARVNSLLNQQATRQNILKVLAAYRSALSDNDILLIYWAGLSDSPPDIQDIILYPVDAKLGPKNTPNSQTALKLTELISSFSKNIKLVFVADTACREIPILPPNAIILSACDKGEYSYELANYRGGLFTHFFIESLHYAEDLNNDKLISLDEAYNYLYPQVIRAQTGIARQHPTIIGNKAFRIPLVKASEQNKQIHQPASVGMVSAPAKKSKPVTISFESEIPEDITKAEKIEINRSQFKILKINKDLHTVSVEFLDETEGDTILRQGLNTFTSLLAGAEKNYLLWKEGAKLQKFSIPYKNSHALLVAIDDYERRKDPEKRGKTPFRPLDFMVEHSNKLKETLERLGFPGENIHTFYDEEATSDRIIACLKEFYKGGSYASADRVVFYFGGHGHIEDGIGYLVTYDFDKYRPTTTSIAMEDLTLIYTRDVRAHHMLIALDACHSGLTIARTLSGESDEKELKQFHALSIIRSDTEPKARNVLLAGTGDQKALYINGGIFTQELIDGLGGAADMNDDRIIQFDELAWYLRHRVVIKAAETGVRQDPEDYILDRFGKGRVLFFESQ
jgi:uncharacterized caspase-like protein